MALLTVLTCKWKGKGAHRLVSALCAALLTTICCVSFLIPVSASDSNLKYYLNRKYDLDAIQALYPYYYQIYAHSSDGSEFLYYFFFDGEPQISYKTIKTVSRAVGVTVDNVDGKIEYDSRTSDSTDNSYLSFKIDGNQITYYHGGNLLYSFYYSSTSSSAKLIDYCASNFAMDWSKVYNLGNGSTGNSVTNNFRYYGTSNSISSTISPGYTDTTEPTTEPTDPTEPTTDAGSSGQPDSWNSGGETLPAGEVDTFEGVNEEDALKEFESLVDNPDSVLSGTGFLDSVGLFWAIVLDFINSLDAMPVVIALMIFGLIAWVLGR